jgi:hypothetical protein
VRAYAINSGGTAYGDDVTFTTSSAPTNIVYNSDNASSFIQEDSTNGTSFNTTNLSLKTSGYVNVVPTMASATTPSGVASASTEYLTPNYAAWKAFDHSNAAQANAWLSQAGVTTGWLKYQFPTPQVITRYTVQTENTASSTAPKNWTFEGSNDNSTFTVLDTRTNETYSGAGAVNTYTISNSAAYTYYRINVTANNGYANWMAIGELQLMNLQYPTTGYYVTTSNSNQINSVGRTLISRVEITQTEPANTQLRYLVSFDGRSTWKRWNGSAWVSDTLNNIHTNGMTKATLEAMTSDQWGASGGFTPGTFDVAVGLLTTNSAANPTLSQFNILFDGPVLTTGSVTSITKTTATATGDVIDDLGHSVTDRGVVYSTTANPAIGGGGCTQVQSGAGSGAFTANLTGLTEGTTYYVRAYAINSNGTVYGTDVAFMTLKTTTTITFNSANASNFTQEDSTNGTMFNTSNLSLKTAGYTNLVPTMTGYSSPSGTASASTEYNGTYPAWKAFDHSNAAESNAWLCQNGTTTGWLKYQFPSAKVVNKYTIQSENYGANSAPNTWTFAGSNDNSTFTTLDTRTGENIVASGGKNEYTFTNSTAYTYYRINITANNGYSSWMGIGELELMGQQFPLTGYYAATNNTGQINTVGLTAISGMLITQNEPANTQLRYLVSFDGRSTWKRWNGSAWLSDTLTNIHTNGMSKTTLEGITSSQWSASGGFAPGTFDVAVGLLSTSDAATPALSQISIYFDHAPVLTTGSVSSITSSTSTATGEVIDDQGYSVTDRGVVYSTTANPTIGGSGCTQVTSGTGTGAFTANLTSLSGTTTYHVRAYAINSQGTTYGSDISFTTLSNGVDSNTLLMLHMDGTNGSTTFTDSSLSNHTATPVSGAKISTAQSKFGSASGAFNGSSDYLQYSDSADWSLGTNDFTFDWWEYRTASTGNVIGRYPSGQCSYAVGYYFGGNISCYLSTGGAGWDVASGVSMGSAILNAWTHYALVRSGNNFYTFQNGNLISTFNSSASIYNNSGATEIGSWTPGSVYFPGYIDELRFSKGIARWTSNFTPPSAPYSN